MKKLIFILLLLCSCATLSFYNKWKTYTVKAGTHESNMTPRFTENEDLVRFSFKVDSSWYYNIPNEQNGISKITGISFGNVHENSARLGYICIDGKIWICGYCYVNGVSPQENENYKSRLFEAKDGYLYTCTIYRNDKDKEYIFNITCGALTYTWKCPCGKDKMVGAINTPYIGGDFTLDHDVKFNLMFIY